jgi:hypothetical protein
MTYSYSPAISYLTALVTVIINIIIKVKYRISNSITSSFIATLFTYGVKLLPQGEPALDTLPLYEVVCQVFLLGFLALIGGRVVPVLSVFERLKSV